MLSTGFAKPSLIYYSPYNQHTLTSHPDARDALKREDVGSPSGDCHPVGVCSLPGQDERLGSKGGLVKSQRDFAAARRAPRAGSLKPPGSQEPHEQHKPHEPPRPEGAAQSGGTPNRYRRPAVRPPNRRRTPRRQTPARRLGEVPTHLGLGPDDRAGQVVQPLEQPAAS